MDDVASGQRMLILAIVMNLGAVVARATLGDNWAVMGPVAIAAAVLAIMGLLRLAAGLGYSSGMTAVLVALAFVPVISLLMLAAVNNKATKALRAAGYKVGFFGAGRKGRAV